MPNRTRPLLLLIVLLPYAGCGHAAPYAPGLGEIMSLQQMRHCKLWFAGQAQNWELAAYEADELAEGFADAMLFHADHKDSPVPLTKAIPTFVDAPMRQLGSAIEAKDGSSFVSAFDALTAGCNGCHAATRFGFNVVVRPQQNPYPNQVFDKPK